MRRLIGISLYAVCLLATIILFSDQIFAQKNVIKGNQQWLHYYNQTKLSERWTLLIDGGYRWEEDLTHRIQYMMRAAGGFLIGPGIRIAAGVGHWASYGEFEVEVAEIRPHQELTVQHKSKVNFSQRLRIEERFVKATSNNDNQFDRFNWRFRYSIGCAIPIIKSFGANQQMALNFLLADEVMINAGKKVVYNVFDQNRIIIGTEWQLNSNLGVSLAYQGRFSSLNLPSQYAYNHILWFAVKHKLDLTKTAVAP